MKWPIKYEIMKRRIILVWVLVIVPMLLLAQRQGRRFEETLEKYKSERVAYLSQKLNLEVNEAELFWPVYNEFQTKRETLMKDSRPNRMHPSVDSLSNEQMEAMMDKKILNELKLAELATVYHKKYKAILPTKKIFILYHAEQEFMGQMIQRMRNPDGMGRRLEGSKRSDGRKPGTGRDF